MFSQSKGLQFNREAAIHSIADTVEDGIYVADFFSNTKVDPVIYHYIITRRGSNEILDWGQGFSMESIRNEAQRWMSQFEQRIAG